MFEYPYILADSSDEIGLYQGDVTGVGEVEEWFEADHEVGGESALLALSDDRLAAVGDKLVVGFNIRHNLEHLGWGVANPNLQ